MIGLNFFVKRKLEKHNAKLFVHDDTDGSICSFLAQKTFDNIDIEYCSNSDVNDEITSFIIDKKYKDFDTIFIIDIALDAGTASLINKLLEIEKENIKIKYIDHHKSTLWLNEYPWAEIVEKEGEIPTCASELAYRHFVTYYNLEPTVWITNLVEKTRIFDTWEWKYKYNDTEAKRLNTLCFAIGNIEFTKTLLEKEKTNKPFFNESDMNIIKKEERKYEAYLKKKSENILLSKLTINNVEYKVGTVYAEEYISELGSDIADKYDNLDFIMIINAMEKISFRAAKNKNIDLSEIATKIDGGGHPKAAGATIDLDTREKCLSYLTNTLFDKDKS